MDDVLLDLTVALGSSYWVGIPKYDAAMWMVGLEPLLLLFMPFDSFG